MFKKYTLSEECLRISLNLMVKFFSVLPHSIKYNSILQKSTQNQDNISIGSNKYFRGEYKPSACLLTTGSQLLYIFVDEQD